jgi:hypothetical protein
MCARTHARDTAQSLLFDIEFLVDLLKPAIATMTGAMFSVD